ncbi:MAG TPA: metal-dependent hydrolase [Candidatus Dormibacteraeota bacterium]|nr:metal-dependent hydrolase [Candidatus Dormibacteraeota bacterium]
MEPVTHALTSIALGRAGLNKMTRMATPMLLVSGLIADVDWVTRLGGANAFLRGHRTATHSLVGTVVMIAGVAAGFWLAGRKYPKLSVRMMPALLLCAIGAGMHLLLDLMNGYGVKLLWPFSQRWFAWDIANSVDAWILFFLLAGLLLPELFRLVLEEIGTKPKQHSRQRGAIVGLALVALFIAGRAFAHQRAVALLNGREYRSQVPLVVGAFPKPLNPLAWSGVVETDNALVNVEVPLGPGLAFDPESADVHFKPEPSLALTNAVRSATAAAFLNYARFPLASIAPEGDGYQVRLRDMRFASELPGQRGIIAVIDLNAQSLVVHEHLEFDPSP